MKRYVREEHSDQVLRLMEADGAWSACALALVESHVTLCARFVQPEARDEARRTLDVDWQRFAVVALGDEVLARAVEISCQFGTRTLDSIHLAAAERLPTGLTCVTFGERLAAVARTLGLAVAP